MGNSKRAGLIIIKLGGSTITYKSSSKPRLRNETIENLSKELATIYKNYQLIIVHGAGSFGHPLAKKYKLTEGLKYKNSAEGFSKTTDAMLKLNKIITGYLIKAGLPTVTLLPRGFITQTNGRMNPFDFSIIESILAKNLVPVLAGDVVLDSKLGCSIISGDIIVAFLAKKLKATKVIYLSDVDGIFDSDPKKNKSAQLIKEVNSDNLSLVLKGLKSSGRDDVTGEMEGKIREISRNFPGGKVHIINGLKKGNLTKIMQGQAVGSLIRF